ncbi:unnamed protein product [Blepharisma stoltei]|uniref:RGS domain-containing protein n=1 Tax=Blepharisma stoltei TaxID=1481888 RepID=A0AAU9JJ25_9CILI|nr:unnamed protein product [Blepharisma stoltei]
MLLYIIIAFLFVVYFAIGVMLYKRRTERNIKSRSPVLIYITHWSNLIETLLAIPILTPKDFNLYDLDYYENRLYQDSALISHYLVFFPYILRCYRLYFVFHLDKDWEIQNNMFKENIHRTRQRWLVKMLCFCMIPIILISVVFLFWPNASEIFPLNLSRPSNNGIDIPDCVYIMACFTEQLVLIIGIYLIKDVSDDFNMSNELIYVGFIWFLTPAFSIYIRSYQIVWGIPYILRNILLMLRSSLVPIICSYFNKPLFEPLTIEMLNSLELTLQNAATLEAFEEFLKLEELTTTKSFGSINTGSGLSLLEFYLKCRLFANNGSSQLAENIFSEYLENKVVHIPAEIYLEIEDGDFTDANLFNKAESVVIEKLKSYFYPKFMASDQYLFLKRLIHRQEIYQFRLMQTSLHEFQINEHKKMVVECDDWPVPTLD